jgi:tetratricopeptide (TPR) repeat protein
MNRILLAACCAALLGAPTLALADGGGAPSMPQPSQPASTFDQSQQHEQTPEEKAAQDKQHADELYAEAYREVDKAKAELAESDDLRAQAASKGDAGKDLAKKADQKADSARKRLEKSRDKFDEVTKLDPNNADGWNMLGFTRRKTGDRKAAFDAYWKCLAIKPEHFGAHEYLGEADLEEGKIADARAELAWLQKHLPDATNEASHLSTAIDKWVASNPSAVPAAPAAAAPAPAMAQSPSAAVAPQAKALAVPASPDSTKAP